MQRSAVVLWAVAVLSAAGQTSVRLSITEGGVGPINSKTPFNVAEISRLFPKLKVSAGADMTEGQEFPTIEVRDSNGLLFTVMPDADQKQIHSIVTKRGDFYRGKGSIGSPYSQLFGMTVSDACYWGKEELSDDLICQSPGSKSIFLLFQGRFNKSNPTTPDLGRMRVSEVFWSAVAAR